MPIKTSALAKSYKHHYQSQSFENLAASWFTADGWEVLVPVIDHGRKTDLVVSDGTVYYRIQVKSLETADENVEVTNRWSDGDAHIDYVIYFSRTSHWGYIIKPFKQHQKKLNTEGHIRFHQHPKHFSQAFARI